MHRKFFTLLCFFLASSSSFAGEILNSLVKTPEFRNGHGKLVANAFTRDLSKGNFRREQIAVFFTDRIHILKIMESFLPQVRDFNELSVAEKVLYRSHVYEEELKLLVGEYVTYEPTDAAKNYGIYLKSASREVALVHLYLYLVGETAGGKNISEWINNKYKSVGKLMFEFENTDIERVKEMHEAWIAGVIGSSSLENYGDDIKRVLDNAVERFKAVKDLPSVGYLRSTRTVLSEHYYWIKSGLTSYYEYME